MPGNAGYKTTHGRHNTQGQYRFSEVPGPEIQRSAFNRSSGLKTTFDSGFLVPMYCDEALPGDTFAMTVSSFARMSTPLRPVMDNMYMDCFFFGVPVRLLWDNWQKMNGEQVDPGDPTDFLVPQLTAPIGGHLEQSLSDYFGIPTKVDITHSSLWHRAYNLIYNEWFRDENLQDSVVVDRDDGPDTDADYVLLRRGKRHDYFTSALPFPQKGPAVQLPLGTSAPLVGTTVVSAGDGEPVFDVDTTNTRLIGRTGQQVQLVTAPANDDNLQWDDPKLAVSSGAFADLTNATAATINQLREAFQVQKLFERDARGGTRYTEIVRSHFGVISPDQRLQRPEYLGGGTATINVNPVANTAGLFPGSVGQLAGFVTSSGQGMGFTKSFVEHSVILGMCMVRADLNYQQGLERMFSRRTRFDFYWPALAHLGEQSVLNKEIFADGSAADELTFGFQERYAEYRYKPSHVTGQMRSNSATPLDVWHLAQDFAALPVLDDTFIVENPPIGRVIAVPSEPEFLADFFFDLRCARPMPVYSVPGLIDHF